MSNLIKGKELLDKTVTEQKLSDELQAKINSGGEPGNYVINGTNEGEVTINSSRILNLGTADGSYVTLGTIYGDVKIFGGTGEMNFLNGASISGAPLSIHNTSVLLTNIMDASVNGVNPEYVLVQDQSGSVYKATPDTFKDWIGLPGYLPVEGGTLKGDLEMTSPAKITFSPSGYSYINYENSTLNIAGAGINGINILTDASAGATARVNNVEILTRRGNSLSTPVFGDIVLQNGRSVVYTIAGNTYTGYSVDKEALLMVSSGAGGILLNSLAGDINLITGGSGKVTYNGVEIATKEDVSGKTLTQDLSPADGTKVVKGIYVCTEDNEMKHLTLQRLKELLDTIS